MSDPRQKDFDERHTRLPTVTALTKREYFAAMALSAMIDKHVTSEHELVVVNAIKFADELLKQLES